MASFRTVKSCSDFVVVSCSVFSLLDRTCFLVFLGALVDVVVFRFADGTASSLLHKIKKKPFNRVS